MWRPTYRTTSAITYMGICGEAVACRMARRCAGLTIAWQFLAHASSADQLPSWPYDEPISATIGSRAATWAQRRGQRAFYEPHPGARSRAYPSLTMCVCAVYGAVRLGVMDDRGAVLSALRAAAAAGQ